MRTVLLVLAALPMIAAEGISGKWSIDGDVAGHSVVLNCSVETKPGSKIGGGCSVKGSDGASEMVQISGETKGESFNFVFTTAGGYTLTYTGTVAGDTMKGDIEVSGASGSFTGKRSNE